MAIIENKKILPAVSTYSERGEQWGELFEEIGFIKDGNKYYLDETGGIGFDTETNSNTIRIIYDTNKYLILYIGNYGQAETVYWQESKGGKVIYIYNVDPESVNASGSVPNITLIIANSADGWCIIYKGNIYFSEGAIHIPTDTSSNAATPYTAAKMPVLFGNGTFDELYRIITAGQFALQYTYVMFNESTCRIATVSGYSGKNNECLPGFAFPVNEEE